MNFLLIAIGGFFGSMTRFYISQQTRKYIGTWIANITGSILLGFVMSFYVADYFSHSFYLLLGVGFCGAFTTFTTFGHETLQLILHKKYRVAALYVFSTFAVSLTFVALIFFFINGWT